MVGDIGNCVGTAAVGAAFESRPAHNLCYVKYWISVPMSRSREAIPDDFRPHLWRPSWSTVAVHRSLR